MILDYQAWLFTSRRSNPMMPHPAVLVSALGASTGLLGLAAIEGSMPAADRPIVYVLIAATLSAVAALWALVVKQLIWERKERAEREVRSEARYEREQKRNDELLQLLQSLVSQLQSRPCIQHLDEKPLAVKVRAAGSSGD